MQIHLVNIRYVAETLSRKQGEELEYFIATAALDEEEYLEVEGLGPITAGTFQLHRKNEKAPVSSALHYLEPSLQFANSKGGWFSGYLSVEPAVFDRWLRLHPFHSQVSVSLDFGIGAPGLDQTAPDSHRWNVSTHRMLAVLSASVVFGSASG